MALIKCPECGKEISDRAEKCPNCGCPIEEQKNEVDSKTVSINNVDSKQEKSKKKIPKKVIVGLCSIIIIIAILVIIYFIATMDSRNYKTAQALYKSEKYEQALSKFNSLGDYKNSKEMVKKCEYEVSVDGRFMKALSKGLMLRWDYSDEGYKEEFGKDEEDLNSTEYTDMLRKCVNYELDSIGKFKSQKFNNDNLGKDASEYIDLLNQSLSAIDYYVMDFNKYTIMWDDLYSNRMLTIRKFVDEYGLKVDKAHQKTLDEFITNAGVAQEQNALETSIDEMVSKYTYEMKDDGYGNISYIVNLENTTNVTFDYFGCDVDVLDANGTIIYTGYTGEINDFSPGQKAQLEVYTGVQGASLKFHPNYYVKQ